MAKFLKWFGIVVGVFVLIWIGMWAWTFSTPPELEVGPDTTVIEEPLREDGTVDYLAALNDRYSEDVTPQNNAFVIIAELMAPTAWDSPTIRQKVFDELDVPLPGGEAAYFEPFEHYGERRASETTETESPEQNEDGERPTRRTLPPSAVRTWQQQEETATEGPWAREDAPMVADWLEEQNDQLDRVGEAARRSHYWSPYVTEHSDGLVWETLLSELSPMRGMAEGLQMRALHRLHAGDVEGAIHDAVTLKRLGRHIADRATLIEFLVGLAVSDVGGSVITAIAADENLTAGQARELLEVLRELPSFNIAEPIDVGERFIVLDVVQRLSDAGELDPSLAPLGAVAQLSDPNRAMRQFNRFYDQNVAAATAPTRADRLERWAALEAESEELGEAAISPSLAWIGMAFGSRDAITDAMTDVLLGILGPSFGNAAEVTDRTEQEERLELTALALAGYRAEHGNYPESLEALVPDWLDAVPVDVFDADESAIRYRVEDERVLIYSVGPNGKDDGGTQGERPDQGDTVIELPRSP